MRIATFNANSVRARLDIVLDWLNKHDPDVLCMQETKVRDEEFPLGPFQDAGYHVSFKGQKSYNGVAIISKTRPVKVSFGLGGRNSDETRLAYARFGALHVINTYVPQGREITHEMYQYKLKWFRRLKKYFDQKFTARMKVVWVGDLNVAPEAMDIHNAVQQAKHVCYHVDVRRSFASTVGWGFVDVFRMHHSEPGCYTFFDYRQRNTLKENKGWRIDHVLATPSLAKKCTDSFIDLEPRGLERPSDHTFLVADFAI